MTTIRARLAWDGPIPAEPGDTILFSWIPAEEVPKSHRALVRKHVRRLARQNGLEYIDVVWYDYARPSGRVREVAGSLTDRGDWSWTADDGAELPVGIHPDDNPGAIGLHAGLRGEAAVAFVVAHEVAHLLQRGQGRPVDEPEARRFSSAYVRKLGLA